MLCYKCKEYDLILNFENFIVTHNPQLGQEFSDILDKSCKDCEQCITCSSCGEKILSGETYFDSELTKSKIFKVVADEIMEYIKCCSQCDDGEFIKGLYPSINSHFSDPEDNPEEIFESFDTCSEIKDVLYDVLSNYNNSWEPYYKDIVEYIQCPSCKNGSGIDWDEKIDHGKFDLYTEVYTEHDLKEFNHRFYGDVIENINEEINKLVNHFTLNELIELRNEYIRSRVFVGRTEAFEKLYEVIKTSCIVYFLNEDRMIFRTRLSNIQEDFTPNDVWQPPYEKAGQGRYNVSGESVLYCSNNINVLKKEVPCKDDTMHNIGVFRVLKPLVLLPINYFFGQAFDGLISEEVLLAQNNDNFKKQYIISNIVSSISKEIGYKGIVYQSTKDKFSINYALFDMEKNIDLECIKVLKMNNVKK